MIMGVLFLTAGIAGFFLPETLGQRLPETLEDAQEFGKRQPMWGIPKSEIVQETVMGKYVHTEYKSID